MNADLKDAFSRIKPVCDVLMVCPAPDSIATFITRVSDLKKEVVQDLQQYLLFPLITHLNTSDIEKKYELQRMLVDAMRIVLEKVTVNSFEMCVKMEIGLLQLVFDQNKPGMIADSPEELKLSVMQCLTVLLLNIDPKHREKMLKTHVPLLGKTVYVSVHIAKLEKLRTLRLAAIQCVTAHTASHMQLTKNYHIPDPAIENLVVEMLSMILPGVLGALQDVATCKENPGHALVVAAINAIHRILCMAMNNKYMNKTSNPTPEDFVNLIREKSKSEVSSKVDPKDLPVRSPEWFSVAGDKLLLVTKSLVSLRTHEHFKVRKELAVYCSRLLSECNIAMQSSVPLILDTLISLTKDDYKEVSKYCTKAVNTFFANASDDSRLKTLDALSDNFFATLDSLPRVMNNIDSNLKLSSLNLLHGYIQVLSAGARPQRLTCALSELQRAQRTCVALLHAAAMLHSLTMLTHHAVRDVTTPPPQDSPWCKFRHLDTACERRLQDICRLLGDAECAELLLDRLLELFQQTRDPELLYICNHVASAPNSSENLIKRILDTYIEESVWYLPLQVGVSEEPLTVNDTMDVTVYNPRSWHKDSVPGLYEGQVETRYTDISLSSPRAPAHVSPDCCATLADAQRNMLLSCLLTEGVGKMARRLMHKFQPYLLKTLCLVLERVGSKYEMLHLAGLKAVHDISLACGHGSVAELIKCNADYFTNQVTVRLKKAWNCQSALQILSVVMEYSDSSILNYLYGIVEDVLVQSCDKFYENDLHSYLKVYLTFVECIRKWYTIQQNPAKCTATRETIDVLRNVREFIESNREMERLLSENESEKESGRSVEEMYRDLKNKEEDELDYDDRVTEEKPPPPQHITVTITILKRCLNYVVCSQRDNCIIALQILNRGLPILSQYEDELLPLIHLSWEPLVATFRREPPVMKRAFDLLVTVAGLSKDFIRSRANKDVLPHMCSFLRKSSADSFLKDVGSAYRNSPAYGLQLSALEALPLLATDLQLQDDSLDSAMSCVDPYLSKKQPKALQSAAVHFFKAMLIYDYAAVWYHLREICDNEDILTPPTVELCHLEPVVGSPFTPRDTEYLRNIQLIFEYSVS